MCPMFVTPTAENVSSVTFTSSSDRGIKGSEGLRWTHTGLGTSDSLITR